MPRREVITGTGIISALGDRPADVHAALCNGERAGGAISGFGDREFSQPGYAAPVEDFSPATYLGDQNFRPLDRTGQLAVSASQLALESAGWTPELREAEELDLVVGTTFCSARTITEFDRKAVVSGPKYAKPLDFANTVINAAGGHTAIWHNLRGANTTVVAGQVSGLRALKYAQMQISESVSKVALVGGVEEFCFETHQGFLHAGQIHCSNHGSSPIPFHRDREGFILGEAGAFVIIEDHDAAKERGAEILGMVLGHGSSYDTSRGRDEDNAVARCAEAMRQALGNAEVRVDEIDCIISSANGSKVEDRYEALGLGVVFGDALGSIPLTAISGSLGETLGASAMLQLIAFLETARTGKLPGISGIGGAFDESLPALRVGEETVEGEFKTGLLLSLGFDGSSAASVVAVRNQ